MSNLQKSHFLLSLPAMPGTVSFGLMQGCLPVCAGKQEQAPPILEHLVHKLVGVSRAAAHHMLLRYVADLQVIGV